jgi:hypothetical protein
MTQAATFCPRPTQTILAAALLAFFAPHPFTVPPTPQAHARHTGAVEASTPDVGEQPPEPFPVLQRLKHLARLGLDRWHRLGHRGKGVKVAVLDSGFRGYREHLGKALPKQVTVRSFRDDRNLERATASTASSAVRWSMPWHPRPSYSSPTGSRTARRPSSTPQGGHGNKERRSSRAPSSCRAGAMAKAMAPFTTSWPASSAAAKTTVICCVCERGNLAQPLRRHVSRRWQGLHEWRPGRTENLLTPWGDERVSVELCWQEGADEVIVHDTMTGEVVGRDHRDENARGARWCDSCPRAGGRTR